MGVVVGCGLDSAAVGAESGPTADVPSEPVPMHFRYTPTKAMKAWGYGSGYQHAHQYADAVNEMECLPESLAGKRWYYPTERGIEKRIKERIEELRGRRGRPL